MEDSNYDWLALREPHDHAARSVQLTIKFIDMLDAATQLIDLGCGTGSNYRYLSPQMAADQPWLCLDNNPAVLSRATKMHAVPNIEFAHLDLVHELSRLPIGRHVAITTSAFLDMTSAAWLRDFAALCKHVPILAAMTSDGRIQWEPMAEDDEPIRREILVHQRSDQGFGPALGAVAARFLAQQLSTVGHSVTLAASDWSLGPRDRGLIEVLLAGIHRRVCESSTSISIDRWYELRKRQLHAGELRMTVGHIDLLGVPTETCIG